jgi:epoxide hydrolase-like predicted phosphatase
MTLQAVFFDMGGVILRTEYQAPRQHLADRLGMDYADLVKLVFGSETARLASIGLISEDEHWAAVARRLNLPESQTSAIREEFFAGDIIDLPLVEYARQLRSHIKVGLLSNAWSGMRDWIVKRKFADAFDNMTISAEVGVMKPDVRIYLLALEKLGVAASESVFLDDFPENVEGARAVGMNAILFNDPEKAIGLLKKQMANHK